MSSKLFFICLFIFSVFSAQRNREAEALERQEKRDKYFYEKNEKVGIKNDRGKKITKPIFDDVEFLTKELFLVRKDTLNGVLDKYGKIVIPIKYKTISSYIGAITNTENFSVTDFNGITSLYNKYGKMVFPPMIYGFEGYDINEHRNNLSIIVLCKFYCKRCFTYSGRSNNNDYGILRVMNYEL